MILRTAGLWTILQTNSKLLPWGSGCHHHWAMPQAKVKVAASLVGCALWSMDASRGLDGRSLLIMALFCCSYPGKEHKDWPWDLCGREILSLGIAVLDQCRKLSGKRVLFLSCLRVDKRNLRLHWHVGEYGDDTLRSHRSRRHLHGEGWKWTENVLSGAIGGEWMESPHLGQEDSCLVGLCLGCKRPLADFWGQHPDWRWGSCSQWPTQGAEWASQGYSQAFVLFLPSARYKSQRLACSCSCHELG